MKLKDGWDKIYDEKLDPGTQARMANSIRRSLESKEHTSAGFLDWLFRPIILAPALGALAVAVVFILPAINRQPPMPLVSSVRHDPEMIQNAELLFDLRVLRNMDALEKMGKAKWRKKKS